LIKRLTKIVRLNAPLKTPFPASVNTAKLVVYVKRSERHYADRPKKFDSSHRAFQGHLKVIGS